MKAIRLLIRGSVQGVGFRFFAERAARGLRICGFVRNLPDGRVEAVAGGSADRVQVFVERLKEGPSSGRVDAVEISEAELPDDLHQFEIRHH